MSDIVPLIPEEDLEVPLIPEEDLEGSASSEELRIILLGKTGSGKSSTGNTILADKHFKEEFSAVSVTKTCESGNMRIGEQTVSVIDTPGLFDTTMSRQAMKDEIVKCVYMSLPGPHVFLLVLRLGVRFTDEERSAVNWIQENFGEMASFYTIILFTHADQLKEKDVATYVRESNDLCALVSECDGRYHSFNNEGMNDRSQVSELMEKIEKLLEKNGGQHYTNEMFQEAQRKTLNRAEFWSGQPRIVLLGKTQSGKNSAVETIVGQESFRQRNSPNTETCELHEAQVCGKSFTIINTPGLTDEPKKTKKDIKKFVIMSRPGPHVFLLVIKMNSKSIEEVKNTMKWVQENIGEDAAHYSVVLFTHLGLLEGNQLDENNEDHLNLQALTESFGCRYHLFNNEDEEESTQVIKLLEKIEKIAEGNGWMYYTNEEFKKILKRNAYLERAKKIFHKVATKVGPVGATAIVAGGVVLGVTELVVAPVILLVGGSLVLFGAAGLYIGKKFFKK